ncbi:MAG: hypothetical protein ACJ741_19720, partial [Pyrinomonadaceae bacterium]
RSFADKGALVAVKSWRADATRAVDNKQLRGAGQPLKELVARVSPTPLLLIATGGSLPVELGFNRIYAEAAREPSELWELPKVNHTAEIRERPNEYEQRVVGFFDKRLLAGGGRRSVRP